jgi:hypothetical protein
MPPKKTTSASKGRKYNFKVIDVKPDGNCFFRAIYKSAKHSGNLAKLVSCFLDKPLPHYNTHERDFIMDMREKLAKSIENGNDGGQINEIFQHLSGFDITDKEAMETYSLIVDSLPSWISTRFAKPPKSLTEFRSEVCKNIRKQGTYVSQIEIDIFKYLNDTFCNTPDKHVVLTIFATTPKVDINLDHINILNVANIHYKYLRSYQSIDNTSVSKSSSSFADTTSSSSPSSDASTATTDTTLSTVKSADSSDTKLNKSLQKLMKGKLSSSASSIPSEVSSSNPSSGSSETKKLMASFKDFVQKTTKK